MQHDSYTRFLFLQFCLFSLLESHGGQGFLPQCMPFPRSLLKLLTSFWPPASWNLILKPVSSLILSSLSFSLPISSPPFVLGTKTTVLLVILDFPAFWKILFLDPPMPSFPVGFPPSLYQFDLFIAFVLAFLFLLQPALQYKGWNSGWSVGSPLFLFFSMKLSSPFTTAFLMNSSLWPLVFIFLHAFSMISNLVSISSSKLVFLSLLVTSSARVESFTSWLNADPASTIRLDAMVFSKNSNLTVWPSMTQILVSKLGSFPSPKSSPSSIVNFKNGKTSFIIAIRIMADLLEADNPDSLSSCSQSSVWHKLPPTHLQPGLMPLRKALMSSI